MAADRETVPDVRAVRVSAASTRRAAKAPADGEQVNLFTRRLRDLVDTVYPRAQGRPYTTAQIARGVSALGVPLTRSYVGMLLSGERGERVSFLVVEAIARFFGVELGYFSQTTTDEAQQDFLERARRFGAFVDERVGQLAERAALLDAERLGYVAEVLERELRQQGAGAARR